MDSIQAWEIYAQLGVRGADELKIKLQEIDAAATKTQQNLSKLGDVKPAGGGADAGQPPWMRTFMYGAGGGQGASTSPTAPAGGPGATGGGGTGGGGGGGGRRRGGGAGGIDPTKGSVGLTTAEQRALRRFREEMSSVTTGATSAQVSSIKEQLGIGPGSTAASSGQIANMKELLGVGPGSMGASSSQIANMKELLGVGPGSRGATAAEVAAMRAAAVNPMAARMSQGTVPSSMIVGMSQAGRTAVTEERREKAIQNQLGLMRDSRAATAEEIDITKRSIKAQRDLTDQSDKAGRKIGEFGLRTAWIIRSATAGGPLGMIGGGLGTGIGAMLGNAGFGALIGNIIAQSASSGIEGMHGLVAKRNPAAASRFERAKGDMQASFGEALTVPLEKTTGVVREFGDVVAANRSKIEYTFELWGKALRVMTLGGYGAFEEYANRPGVKGASVGKMISPLGGHIFGSADELYRSVAALTIMQGPTGQNTRPAAVGTGPTVIDALTGAFRGNSAIRGGTGPTAVLPTPGPDVPGAMRGAPPPSTPAGPGGRGGGPGGEEGVMGGIMERAIADHLSYRVV